MRLRLIRNVFFLECVWNILCEEVLTSTTQLRGVSRAHSFGCALWNTTSAFQLRRREGNDVEHFCSDILHVPALYTVSTQNVHSSPVFSIWPRFEPGNSGTDAPCKQRKRAELCVKHGEIALFVLEDSNSQYECRCDHGFFRLSRNTPCQACPSGSFCPVYTEMAYTCPEHSRLAPPHFPAMAVSFEHCVPDLGYRIQAAHEDFQSFLLAPKTSEPSTFYTVLPCPAPCFERMQCDAEELRADLCLPGRKHVLELGLDKCEVCPADHYCMPGNSRACPLNSYTNGTGHDDLTDCKCLAGFSRNIATEECTRVSDISKYTRDCVSRQDNLCGGILLDCPEGRMCKQGILLPQCRDGDYVDIKAQKCASCPVGFFCRHGIMHKCPPGSSTVVMRASNPTFCFCTSPFSASNVSGTMAGFVCTLENSGNSSSAITTGNFHLAPTNPVVCQSTGRSGCLTFLCYFPTRIFKVGLPRETRTSKLLRDAHFTCYRIGRNVPENDGYLHILARFGT